MSWVFPRRRHVHRTLQYRYIPSISRRWNSFIHQKTGVGHEQRGKTTGPVAQPGVFSHHHHHHHHYHNKTGCPSFFFGSSLPRSCITLGSCVSESYCNWTGGELAAAFTCFIIITPGLSLPMAPCWTLYES